MDISVVSVAHEPATPCSKQTTRSRDSHEATPTSLAPFFFSFSGLTCAVGLAMWGFTPRPTRERGSLDPVSAEQTDVFQTNSGSARHDANTGFLANCAALLDPPTQTQPRLATRPSLVLVCFRVPSTKEIRRHKHLILFFPFHDIPIKLMSFHLTHSFHPICEAQRALV